MKKERTAPEITTSEEKIANSLLTTGTIISVAGIGLLTSWGATENPKLFTAGGISFIVGLAIFSTGKLLAMISK